MVISAREDAQKEHEIVQRRNDQLKAQLADTDSLLRSHQEQLAELKQVMEQLTEERADRTDPTAPSTPGPSKFDSKDNNNHDTDAVHSGPGIVPRSPSYPTSFTHLLHTVLRTDLSAYDDFTSLLRMSKNVAGGSRVSSGSYGTIGLGLGLGAHTANNLSNVTQLPTNGSTSSLSTAPTLGSAPVTPTTPASSVSTGSTHGPNSQTPLKETKFYKRALAEDIEPALRLDTAPGLSWLARRTVLNSMCEGSLVVEPMPASKNAHNFACSLCGESRKDPAHVRSHRFRTSENDNAQRYPLCNYCLGRVRSTCDFLGFLRVLKDGHWRADDEESERAAWEESVRLREQMFWCRMGGGVVPASDGDFPRSPRVSEDERREQQRKLSEELEMTGEIQPRDITPVFDPLQADVRLSRSTKASSKAVVTDDKPESRQAAHEVAVSSPDVNGGKQSDTVEEITNGASEPENPGEEHNSARDSTQSTTSLQVSSSCDGEDDGAKRLSITIPGSFD